jgi:hypothetical protein
MSVQGVAFPIVDQETSSSGQFKVSPNGDIFIGQNTGTTEDGSNNVIIGDGAAANINGDASGNCIIGASASTTMNGVNNVYMGYAAARNVLLSRGNVVVGASGAGGFTQGSNNVFIGSGTSRYNDVRHPDVNGGTVMGSTAYIGGCNCISIGYKSAASGRDNVAIGSGVAAVAGDGQFSILDRLVGVYVTNNDSGVDTYAVQARCDVVQLARGSGLCFMNDALLSPLSTSVSWLLQLDGDDLVFKSKSGTRVRLVDEFYSGVLDYTAQHHCMFENDDALDAQDAQDAWVGRVVVASGSYVTSSPTIGSAVPKVKLSENGCDPRVLGVIDHVTTDAHGSHAYKLGNFVFDTPGKSTVTAVVNSSGDGGVLVSDENGLIKNGDLLVTSSLLPGVAMRQSDDTYRAATFAKATCDCDFSFESSPNKVTLEHSMLSVKALRVCLIGCIYKS